MSLLDLSRWQFALTVMFHMTFPAITVGLSIFLCVLYGLHWKTGNPVYLLLAVRRSPSMIPATHHPTWPLAAMPPLASRANLGVWKLLRSERDEIDEP